MFTVLPGGNGQERFHNLIAPVLLDSRAEDLSSAIGAVLNKKHKQSQKAATAAPAPPPAAASSPAASSPAASAAVQPAPSHEERLATLKRCHEMGYIDEDEYRAKRLMIIKEM